MKFLANMEQKHRGTFKFPIEVHYVDSSHVKYQMPFHWHLEYELIFVLSGSFHLTLNAQSYELQSGDVAFVPESIVHGGIPSDCIYKCLVFDLHRFLQFGNLGSHSLQQKMQSAVSTPQVFKKNSLFAKTAKRLFEIMEKESLGYELATIGLLWELAAALVQATPQNTSVLLQNTKRAKQMKKVLNRIHTNFSQPLTLEELAEEAGLSPRYFCRMFAQMTGRTPIDYVNFYRIEHASEQMLSTDETVTEIALSCGFNDISYFSKAFRKYKGVSTREFRKAHSRVK